MILTCSHSSLTARDNEAHDLHCTGIINRSGLKERAALDPCPKPHTFHGNHAINFFWQMAVLVIKKASQPSDCVGHGDPMVE
jgi:hypothetical protein